MARCLAGRFCQSVFIFTVQTSDWALSGKQRGGFLLWRGGLIGFVAHLDLLLCSNPFLRRGVYTSLRKQLWFENPPRRRRSCYPIWQGSPARTNTNPAIWPATRHSCCVCDHSQGRP